MASFEKYLEDIKNEYTNRYNEIEQTIDSGKFKTDKSDDITKAAVQDCASSKGYNASSFKVDVKDGDVVFMGYYFTKK